MTSKATAQRYSSDNGPVVLGIFAPVPLDVRWNRESRTLVVQYRRDLTAKIALEGDLAGQVLLALLAAKSQTDRWNILLSLFDQEHCGTLFDQARSGFYRCGNFILQRPA